MLILALCLALQEREPDLELLTWEWTSASGSAFPSWTEGAEANLLYTKMNEDGTAELVLQELDDAARAPHGLEERGSGWFLNWADFPAAARLPNGTLAWTWLAIDTEHPDSYGTRFRVADAARAHTSAARPLEEHRGAGEHGFVSLAPLSRARDETRFLALWLDGREAVGHAGKTALLARVIGGDAEPGPELEVDANTCSCCPTSLVLLENGTHLAAWRDRSSAEVRDIAVARFDGRSWSAPELVHGDGWHIDGCPVNGPRLAAGPDGVAVTWYTGAGGGSVLVSRADPSGRGFGATVRIDDGAPEGRGDLVLLEDGSLLVGWMEHDPELSMWCVRRVAKDGTLGPTLVVAPVSSQRSSGFLRMAGHRGEVLLAYTETLPERRVVVRRLRRLP